MDWTKAKTIIIAALLVTNVFMLLVYLTRTVERPDDEEVLREILKSENIFLETELPRRPRPMAMLYVEPETADAGAVERALAAQAPMGGGLTDRALAGAVEDVLESCGLMTENTRLAGPPVREGSAAVLRYRDVFGDIPIEESYIVCTVEDGRVTDIDRKWYKPLALHDKKGEILAPINALVRLISTKEREERLVIREVELVYRVSPVGLGSESPVGDTALPAWRIVDAQGDERFVAAYE
jgi:hypothetical protein